MKIVVYNSKDQYVLSRRDVETLRAILPELLWEKIQQFHLCDDSRRAEVFEYSDETKTVYFSCLVKQKSPELIESVIRELLIGLARLQAGSKFFLPLKPRERELYSDFVSYWLPLCLTTVKTSRSHAVGEL